jgi:FAD/FMN-containing dehydrogenase
VAHPFGAWADPCADAQAIRWVRDVCADLEPWSTGQVYLNFIGYEGQDRVIAGFGAANYDRLARVKCEYDPDNVFHLNQNIEPGWR